MAHVNKRAENHVNIINTKLGLFVCSRHLLFITTETRVFNMYTYLCPQPRYLGNNARRQKKKKKKEKKRRKMETNK